MSGEIKIGPAKDVVGHIPTKDGRYLSIVQCQQCGYPMFKDSSCAKCLLRRMPSGPLLWSDIESEGLLISALGDTGEIMG